MAYKLEFVDQTEDEDEVFESHGVKVVIDPKSLAYLDGTELDFVKEGLNEGFKFNNPNVKDQCGCGESFNVCAAPDEHRPDAGLLRPLRSAAPLCVRVSVRWNRQLAGTD